MTKGQLIEMLKYIEDDVEILARDSENKKSYSIKGVNPARTIEAACIIISESSK